jgi:hypothetical protein
MIQAKEWIAAGHKVFARITLTGCGGSGIIVCNDIESLPPAPLYTKRVKIEHEYRIHVFKESVIDFVMKKKLSSEQRAERGVEVDSLIRNHSNGWVFAREGVTITDELAQTAGAAVASLGLDFGAVDICTTRDGRVCVFEVNTAPGIEGTTLEKYVAAFKSCLGI